MSKDLVNWKTMAEGSEKYQAYLCSPEWGKRRAAVARRSKGACERGCGNRAAAVHHLTYAHKYCETLEDLIHLCELCHDYQHGRLNRDPVLDAHMPAWRQLWTIIESMPHLQSEVEIEIRELADRLIDLKLDEYNRRGEGAPVVRWDRGRR